MLTLYHNGSSYPLQVDDYYIRELVSGLNEIIFELSIRDPVYMMIQEEEQITDRGGQRYLVKQIDAGATSAKIICQLDLDAWKQTMYVGYNSGSKTCRQTIEAVAPTGWTVVDRAYYSQLRTIKGDYTPLEICQACCKTYKVYVLWDNKEHTATIYPQTIGDPIGAFATRELNLKEINYKGKSTDFATRIYPYGKDGLTIQGATIDGAAYPYAYIDDHSYSDKIISVYWKDERYTIAQNLYDDAKDRLAQMAKPVRAYDCSIVDLKATNPDKYVNLDFGLLTVAMLVDDTKGTAVNYQVVERHTFPYYPEKNEVIFDSAPQKITTTVTDIADALDNPNSDFQQILDTEIELATGWLTSADSYIRIVRNADGSWKELLFLDGSQPIDQATHVMLLNSAGLGFSKNGINGPYTSAFVFDNKKGGHLIADVITAGTMSADRVRAGTLQSVDGKMVVDLDNGKITLSKAKALVITAGNFQLNADGDVSITGDFTSQSGNVKTTLSTGIMSVYQNNSLMGKLGMITFNSQPAIALECDNANGLALSINGTAYYVLNRSGMDYTGYGFRHYFNGDLYSTGRYKFENGYGFGSIDNEWIQTGASLQVGGQGAYGNLKVLLGCWVGGEVSCDSLEQRSDRNLKQEIEDLSREEAKRVVMSLRPVTYRWRKPTGRKEPDTRLHHGFIAQEMQEIVGNDWGIVTDREGGLTLNYTELLADAVSVIQQQQEKIDELEARLARLESLLEGDGK